MHLLLLVSILSAGPVGNVVTTGQREAVYLQALPVIDSMTFAFALEALQRGNRSNAVSLGFVSKVIERHLLTVHQVMALLELVTQSSDKLKLVQLVAHHLADPEAAAALYTHFTQVDDQRALAVILLN